MQARVKTLERLKSLYGVLTHVQELALHKANAAVHEAEVAIDTQKTLARRSSDEALAALNNDDKRGWMIHESQRGFMQRDAKRLLTLRQDREALRQDAAELYRANRIELEQMRSVLGDVRHRLMLEHLRNEQRISDDRFLSRQRWLRRRDAERMNRS